jgi:hypothetical protein
VPLSSFGSTAGTRLRSATIKILILLNSAYFASSTRIAFSRDRGLERTATATWRSFHMYSTEHSPTRTALGQGLVIRAGEVQRTSAGTGICQSEFNHSISRVVHFFQIWLFMNKEALNPAMSKQAFPNTRSKEGHGLSARVTVTAAL